MVMIHILVGNDIKKRNDFIAKLVGSGELVRLNSSNISRESLLEHASNQNLFGSSPTVVVENILNNSDINLSKDDLKNLSESGTHIIFLEDKLLKADESKFAKYGKVEKFDEPKVKAVPKVNTFAIADAFAKCDKISAWTLYIEAIDSGVEPEAISGMLFWKIKNMLLTGSRAFTAEKLKKQSSDLVSLYHLAHRGECDLSIGLEQFILSSLSK